MAGFSQTVFRHLPNLNLQWITRPPLSSCCRSQRLVHSSPRANPLSTQKEVPEGVINFSVGTPGKSLIPKKLVDEAMTDAIAQNDDPFMYQVGTLPCVVQIRRNFISIEHGRAGSHTLTCHPSPSVCQGPWLPGLPKGARGPPRREWIHGGSA
jgi:hypothetical protein